MVRTTQSAFDAMTGLRLHDTPDIRHHLRVSALSCLKGRDIKISASKLEYGKRKHAGYVLKPSETMHQEQPVLGCFDPVRPYMYVSKDGFVLRFETLDMAKMYLNQHSIFLKD